jgi:hypothetical protein
VELIIKWDRKEHASREGADVFAFEIGEPEESKYLQIWVPNDVQEAIKDRYGDDFALTQVVLGRARRHLQTATTLKRINNVVVDDATNPLDGEPVSTVDPYCDHLVGRDRSGRCEIDSDEFRDRPGGCLPSKNSCWRQFLIKD